MQDILIEKPYQFMPPFEMHWPQRMLTKQLRELEATGLVNRFVYAEVPPRVEYELTEEGKSLRPILNALKKWGETHGLKLLDSILGNLLTT